MPASMGDTLLLVTTHVRPSSSSRSTHLRRTGRVSAVAAGAALVLLSAPAHADVPDGWGGLTEHAQLDPLHSLALFVGAPALLFLLIALAVYVPSMVRGEKLLPDYSAGEAQWIGGPRQGVAELPAPDGEDSRAGGASGRW
ncbi:hypothetical protein AAII07_03025 [Microvirga sp. 0TCS3.31]